MKHSIAVVGQGFVGGTLTTVFSEKGCRVFAYDKIGKLAQGAEQRTFPNVAALADHVEKEDDFSGVYFVCVPTPMYEDGAADVSIVEGVLKELAALPGHRIAVIKSTVPPGSTQRWNKQFGPSLEVVFNPEFLTEKNALDDMRNQTRIVLGGPIIPVNRVRDIYLRYFPDVPFLKTNSSTTAELVKYFTNLHLAARVILSCELYQLSQGLTAAGYPADYDQVVSIASYDKRLGGSHMKVPGEDDIMGARGHCFPKDMNAIIAVGKELGIDVSVLQALWAKNLMVVPEGHRDWEQMAGRAVSKRD